MRAESNTRCDGSPTMRRLRALMAAHLPDITWHREGGERTER